MALPPFLLIRNRALTVSDLIGYGHGQKGSNMSESAIGKSITPDATLKSTPDTVLWGYIAANLPPALTVKPGQIVEIEALSHQGLTTNKDPEKFFSAYGISTHEVLSDAKAVYAEVKRPKGAAVHILTGPIYVHGEIGRAHV